METIKTANIFFDRSYGYARAIVTLILGLVLVIWPEQVQKYIMTILGALILAIGVVSIILSYTGKWKNEKVPLLMLNAIVDIAFGLVLIIFPSFFINFIMFVFGLLLLIFSLSDIISLVRTSKTMPLPRTLFIGPVIILILGIVMFFFPSKTGDWLFILFGAGLIIYAVTEFISTYTIRKKIRQTYSSDPIIKEE